MPSRNQNRKAAATGKQNASDSARVRFQRDTLLEGSFTACFLVAALAVLIELRYREVVFH